MLRSVKHRLPKRILKLLFNSYFQSHVRYGISLWGPMCSKTDLKRISKIQNKALKIISVNKNENKNLNKNNSILTVEDQIELELCKLMYVYVNNALPPEIKILFHEIMM